LFIKGYFRERCGDEILSIGREIGEVSERRESHQKQVDDSGDYVIRRLTPVECERLQGFNDNWTKYGKDGELISDSRRYKLLGNAVTVNVVEHIFNNWELVDDG